jgi:hypothetical protein
MSVTAVAQTNRPGESESLRTAERLIRALENENAALRSRLEIERSANAILTELNKTRQNETESLRAALAAKNETIAAKEAVITAQERSIELLRTRKTSIWKRIGDIAIGAAIGATLR